MRTKTSIFTALCLTLLFTHNSRAFPESGQTIFTNSIGMEFVLIPAGSFSVEAGDSDAPVAATATVSKPFYLGKYPVTQKQWETVMGNNPSQFKGAQHPVEQVSWYDAQKFIRRLNATESTVGYRLPTDMEWELAARGGTDTRYFFMKNPKNPRDAEGPLSAYAWFEKNSGKSTHPVGRKKPNPYGLYDMYGNVFEWVQDWSDDLPQLRELTDYRGPASGGARVARGCPWSAPSTICSSDFRTGNLPDTRSSRGGFRLAFALEGADSGAVEVPAWSYSKNHYEIDSPQLSPDNKWLVFTRKLHAPDGIEAELFSEKELKQFEKRRKADPRSEDPEVVLMNMAENSARVIDYGWDPVFSSDQKSLLYAHQTKPTSGRRLLADTFAGNEIRAYDLERKQHATVARPSFGYLSNPAFTDKGEALFALSDAVNGAWGGNVGVGMADPATGQRKVLYAPVKEHGLYHLVNKFSMRDGVGLVLRARPLNAGVYMADTYDYELVDAEKGTVLYNWGEHGAAAWFEVDFRVCPSGGLEVYDGGWKVPASGEASESQKPDMPAGQASSDCAHVAFVSKDKEALTILSLREEAARRWSAPGVIRSMAWSPDASRIALVLSYGENFAAKFDCDELVVVRVSDLPVGNYAHELSELNGQAEQASR